MKNPVGITLGREKLPLPLLRPSPPPPILPLPESRYKTPSYSSLPPSAPPPPRLLRPEVEKGVAPLAYVHTYAHTHTYTRTHTQTYTLTRTHTVAHMFTDT